ncbi:hypothetical protein A2X44_01825 [candidate division CPR3 bacterium GWF2_35_18]|uniref:ATP synthase gamma chain n=1 Tax=candidate division CPR3 bacterium GW2011_GWF2_35_18 TaxID=1618350 RepID=A0A0G0BKA8_UNCC3|nr:MAG: ATP synthase gamma chain [candidate division CPR3 bacterium GW2011_GWF2_35_18]KKP86843.1 MAG: ATP synthase gamma chain [candidate division CPR3 bacterium GW2011_GWE2_35_7]OGB62738.1 MAG: hypothetical protein A2X44_01825 [candidate division CPR3 bacterium GWF2_35_18]OGB65764.1 MAG: hypothetical protein A2250_02085 [candidate division CPR3 bacterium RIFOXYA2_FULL_35_13]OGB79243.1 MAG: hypothetical protein A2296_01025 [candidate division CPR3 bacterium RIFOXYB2_FULL_35_8]OGB80530.1 MAG: h
MQSLEILRNKIKAVEYLGEIAQALEQSAANEIFKTREKILKSRLFFEETWKVYRTLQQLTPERPEVNNKHLVVVLTLNRGMYGNLLNKVLEKGEHLYKEYKADLLITGKKGHNHFIKRNERTIHFFSIPNKVKYEQIEPLKDILGTYAHIHIVFPRYKSAVQQIVEVVSLITKPNKEKSQKKFEDIDERFRVEPNVNEVVKYFNKTIIGILIYNYFQESLLAYNAAQMIEMKNAHDNAEDQNKILIHQYNRKRREQIDAKLRELHKYNYSRV